MNKGIIVLIVFSFFLASCQSEVGNNKVFAQNTVSAQSILDKLAQGEDVFVEGKTIEGNLDFTSISKKSRETQNHYKVHIHGSLSIIDCTVDGEIIGFSRENQDLVRTHFHKSLIVRGSSIVERVDLREASFEGTINFDQTVFQEKTEFTGAWFAQRNSGFTETEFNKEAVFSSAHFLGNAIFFKSTFHHHAFFQNTIIHNDFNIASSEFHDYTNFSNIVVHNLLFANYTKFHGRTYMNSGVFKGPVDFISLAFGNIFECKNNQFLGTTRMHKTRFAGTTHFENNVFFLNFMAEELTSKDNAEFHWSNNRILESAEISLPKIINQ